MDLVLRRENVYEGFQKQWMIRYALSHDSPGKQMRDAMRVTSDGLLIMHARDFIA